MSDHDGQPDGLGFNWDRRLDRGMDELIGIVRGILADGVLVLEEVAFLLDWLERNDPVRMQFFGRKLHEALTHVLADDVLDAEEEDWLLDLLLKFVGGTPVGGHEVSYSTRLPLDDPPPQVDFSDHNFCFTGKFDCGSRRDCQAAVIAAGGAIHKYPIFTTSYVVIGELGSRDWIHSNSGRKIERAVEIRSQGHPLYLISEQHWHGCLGCSHAPPEPAEALGVTRVNTAVEVNAHNGESAEATQQPLLGKTVVVTGALTRFDRKEIEDLIVQLGGKASGSVSKKTSFVIAGKSAGSKLDKAKEMGVEIIDEAQFIKRIGRKDSST